MQRVDNIRTAAILNIILTILELLGGLWTNSLSILSDSLHDLGDSIALTTSWLLEKKSTTPPDKTRTFGYQRLSLLSAVISSVILFTGSLLILSRAIPRLIEPELVNSGGMIGIAVIGLILNGFGFLRLSGGESVSEKVLSWHQLEDILGWVVVLIGSIIIHFTGFHIIDPVMTIGFTVFIVWGIGGKIKETFNIFLQGVPEHIDLGLLQQDLKSVNGVNDVQDLHIWSLEGETDVLSVHLIIQDDYAERVPQIKSIIRAKLSAHHIEHSTIETHLESEDEFDDDKYLTYK
jgi:cobalt-zinc-cadmium efflux system protein